VRIVHVGTGLRPIPPAGHGAVERHIWCLTRALEARGHSVSILHRTLGPHGLNEYAFALGARHQAARLEPDVLHVHTPGVAAVLAALGPKAFVFTSHSRHWMLARGLRERAGLFLERRAVARAREVIAVSSEVRDRIAAAGVRRQVHVVPHGVDGTRFSPDPGRRTGMRLCCVAEVAPHKQQHVVARSLRGLTWTLAVAGPIRDRAYARRVLREGGERVTLLGPLDEDGVVALLRSSEALVHPSISESFGMAVLEGMAAGLPVVAGTVAGLVRHGENGFVVPETLPEGERVARFHEHLEALARDAALRRTMGECGRTRALAEFSWDRVAERVEGVYRRFASESAGPGAAARVAARRGRTNPTSTPTP
jgi:D-inositol-3-phosphate glycosyltransferase